MSYEREFDTTEGWLPIAEVPRQTLVLVSRKGMLGWWALATLNALGEWIDHDSHGPLMSNKLKYEPTHFQRLPMPLRAAA